MRFADRNSLLGPSSKLDQRLLPKGASWTGGRITNLVSTKTGKSTHLRDDWREHAGPTDGLVGRCSGLVRFRYQYPTGGVS